MPKEKVKLLRITTVPLSLRYLLRGQFKYLTSEGYEVLTASSNGPEIEEMKKYEGIDHTIIPFTRKITPLKDLICLIKLFALIRRFKPQIVHTHTPKAGLLGMMAAYLMRVPIRLHTVAGLPLLEQKRIKRKLLDFTEKLTYRCSTKVFPNSNGLKKIIESELGYTSEKLGVIANGSSNGIDTEHFCSTPELIQGAFGLRTDLGIEPSDHVLIFIGRIVTDKGINELIRAFEKLKLTKPAHLLLVGNQESDLDPLLSNTITSIKSNKFIHELGWLDEVRTVLLASDVLVFPSYREGFPNVPLQAGAMGLPSIVTDINGCNELVTDGENGCVIPVKNDHALVEAIERLLKSTDLRKKMASAARERIVEKFDKQIVWEAILAEYQRQLDVQKVG